MVPGGSVTRPVGLEIKYLERDIAYSEFSDLISSMQPPFLHFMSLKSDTRPWGLF